MKYTNLVCFFVLQIALFYLKKYFISAGSYCTDDNNNLRKQDTIFLRMVKKKDNMEKANTTFTWMPT